MTVLWQLIYTLQHLAPSHHQFQERWESRYSFQNEIEMIADVLDAEAEVSFCGPVPCQFVNTVTEPVIVMLPMVLRNEVIKGFFGHLEPSLVLGQIVEPH